MERTKDYVHRHFESLFVIVVLLATVSAHYFVPLKLTFLNFYFLSVIMAGYLVGLRMSVLGAMMCILFITFYALSGSEAFFVEPSLGSLTLHFAAWGGFLVLAGAVVGKQREALARQIEGARELNRTLRRQTEELGNANQTLQGHSQTLERRVKERTEELERSRDAFSDMKKRLEEALSAAMDPSVVELMLADRLRTDKTRASVLFCDLAGFTSYTEERSPEAVVRELNRFLREMEPVLLGYRGHIDKYIGDSIMCEFGVPLDYEHHRLLAVLAALEMQKRLAALEFPLKMRVGIASGPLIMGLVGSARQGYTAIGDVVNLASRMERECEPGGVLIDEDTYEGVARYVDVQLKEKAPDDGRRGDLGWGGEIESLRQELAQATGEGERGELCSRIGQILMEHQLAHEAVAYFEEGLRARPDDRELKLAFAESVLRRDEDSKIRLKGRRQAVAAYRVLGVRDVLRDREKLPTPLADRYRPIEERIEVPAELALRVEALDGSIGHARVVSLLSYAVAEELGMPDGEKLALLHAAFLADLGKQSISHHLLNRRGPLTADETTEIRKHPAESARIAREMGFGAEIVQRLIAHSHERSDGSGYPAGLKGEEIPLGCRIIHVADAYDAMTSWRAFRERWDREAALDELRICVGKGSYDARVVDTLIRLLS